MYLTSNIYVVRLNKCNDSASPHKHGKGAVQANTQANADVQVYTAHHCELSNKTPAKGAVKVSDGYTRVW